MTRRDSLLAALVAVVWGLNFLVIDWGLTGVPPLVFLAARFVLVLIPAVFLVPRPAVSWRVLAVVGTLMSTGQFGFLYVALAAGMPPGLAALVLQAQVTFTIVIAAGVLREVPTIKQLVGVVVGSAGLAVVAFGRGQQVPLLAVLLCLVAALSWGCGNVVSRAAGVRGGLSLTVWSAIVVPVPLLALALVIDGPAAVLAGLAAFGWPAWVSTLYTAGLASLLGYGIFNGLLARNPAAAVVPWVLLVPVVALTAAWLLLGQVPNAAEAGGGALMVAGVLVALRSRPGPGSPPTSDPQRESEVVGRPGAGGPLRRRDGLGAAAAGSAD